MSVFHAELASSTSLRTSLKRGLARQALRQASAVQSNLPRIFRTCADLSPNRKAMERVILRLRRMPGIVRAAIASDTGGLVVVARNLREVVTRATETDLFAEPTLVYTRITSRCSHEGVIFGIVRASFCLHALERLVERSKITLDATLLSTIDAEAGALLRGAARGLVFEDAGDQFVRAIEPGVWAGSIDLFAPEGDWGLGMSAASSPVPAFSARTFLSPDEMRPSVWLRWRADPTLSIR